MKKRPIATVPPYDARGASRTGYHCPQAGWWLASEGLRPRFISEGEVMPAINGRSTHWTLSGEAVVRAE